MVEILYEDRDIIVVVKPAGTPSQKDLSKDMDVFSMVYEHTNKPKIGLIQRLDRPVAGIMVLTKTAEASRFLTKASQKHEIEKNYLAVVCGKAKDQDHLDNYIVKVRGNRGIVSNKKASNSKKALLHYKCLDRVVVEEADYSLLEVTLETGRFHQIRAQLAHHKLPIIGDTKYNPRYKDLKGWFDIGLCAYRLAFEHPTSHKKMSFMHLFIREPFTIFEEKLKLIERSYNEEVD